MKSYLQEILKRKDLIKYIVTSGLKEQHRNSYLGYLWWLLDPLLNIVIYYFIVVVLFKGGQTENFVPHIVSGMIIWRWISTSLFSAARSIYSRAGVIKLVYMPKIIFPICASLTQLFNFAFGLLVIFIFFVFFRVDPSFYLLWLPVVTFCLLLFLTALSLVVAYITVFIRDFDNILNYILKIFFYFSPIIWQVETFPPRYLPYLELNLFKTYFDSFRNILIYQQSPRFMSLFLLSMLSIAVIVGMTFLYKNTEHRFIKAF